MLGCDDVAVQVGESEPVTIWNGERVCDLAMSADGRRMVTLSPDKKIRAYAMPAKKELSW